MASELTLRQSIDLPPHPKGDFDHGGVSLSNGYIFIANTAAGSVELESVFWSICANRLWWQWSRPQPSS